MNKKIYVLLLSLMGFIPLVSSAGLVQLGQSPSQTLISSPYTTSCISNFNHAFYEGQSFRSYETQTANSQGSSREMLDPTNVRIYNPYNALGDSITSNSLGGLLPSFTYRSNGRPGTNHFTFGGMSTLLVYKQVDPMYTVQPSPNPNRTNIAAQLVHNLYRRQIQSRGSLTNIYTMIGTDFNGGGVSQFTANPSARYSTVNDYECQNLYIAKCGDGIQDNPNKTGNAQTNGKLGILINGTILPRTFSAPAEDCDGSDGTPAGYVCDASCKLVPLIINPNCTLQPNQTIYCGQDATLNFNSSNTVSISNLQNIGAGIIQPNQAGYFVVHPTQTTIYGFRANGAPGTTPAMCTATVTVNPNPQPNCSLTPSQTIYAGQDATLNFNSTFTNAVTNLVNISGGIIQPNQGGYFVVHPTQTTTYSFTVSGAACTTPVTCSATVTVLQSPKPALRIDKKLISNVAYHSGDLVGWRVDFGNNGTGIAHNVVLTDYLPASLTYVNSQLYGVTPPYIINTTNIGPNGGVIFSGFDLAPGQTGYFIITGRLFSYELCSQTFNFAYIESTEVQPPLWDSDYFLCYAPTTNLSIDKTINKPIFYPGEAINFTIAVTNNGPDVAQSVQIGDIWPITSSCIIPGGGRTSNMPMTLTNGSSPYAWTLNNTLAVGQTVYLYLTGQVANNVACAGNYINTGTLTYVVNGLVRTGRDETPFIVIVTPSVNVSFVKTITKVGSHAGDEVSFALNYINNGTTPLSSYDIVDYWPGTLTFMGASVTPASIIPVPGGQEIHWTFNGPLAPGAGGTITLNGRIN